MGNQKSTLNKHSRVINNYSSIKLRDLTEENFAQSYPKIVNNKDLTLFINSGKITDPEKIAARRQQGRVDNNFKVLCFAHSKDDTEPKLSICISTKVQDKVTKTEGVKPTNLIKYLNKLGLSLQERQDKKSGQKYLLVTNATGGFNMVEVAGNTFNLKTRR